MRKLSQRIQGWLFRQDRNAHALWLAMYQLDRDKDVRVNTIKEIVRPPEQDLIREAYEKDGAV